jgi:hypothetical protein
MPKMRRYNYGMRHNWETHNETGRLTPTFLQYVTPLDTWGGIQTILGRMSPLNKPVFGQFHYDQYLFYIPIQAIWNKSTLSFNEEFRDVITGQDTSYTWPSKNISAVLGDNVRNNIEHMFGLGLKGAAQGDINVSALPRMAYNHVVNKFFLDGRVDTELTIDTTSTLHACKFKGSQYFQTLMTDVEQGARVTIDTSASTLNINEVSDAMKSQRYAELKERYGEEYEDILKLHGVNPSSMAREEAQLVGKGSTQVGISEVLATATSAGENTGEYVGHGIVVGKMAVPKRLYLDYGLLIGVSVLRPRLMLRNVKEPHWDVKTPEDMYNRFNVGKTHKNVLGETISTIASDAQRAATYAYSPYYHWLRKTQDICTSMYNTDDTYIDQIMAKNAGSAASTIDDYQTVGQVAQADYDYLFQDSAQPHMFTRVMNSIGKRSQIPPERTTT